MLTTRSAETETRDLFRIYRYEEAASIPVAQRLANAKTITSEDVIGINRQDTGSRGPRC